MDYKVRDNFYVHLHNKVYGPGSLVELTADELDLVAHQVEPIVACKPTRKAKADGAD